MQKNNESLLSILNESIHLKRLQGATDEKIKNAFFANYLSALLLIRLKDLKGLMLINDQAHSKLTKFSNQMSDLNFWGKALFYPESPEVKSRLAFGHYEVLKQESGRIMDSRIQKIMKVPLLVPENIDWADTTGALLLLKHRYSVNSSYFNNILYVLHKWDSVNETSKKRAINQAFMYLMQSDPQSALLSRMRNLTTSTMLDIISNVAQKIVSFKRINEDDGGATSTGNVATSDNAIVAGKSMIAQPEFKQDANKDIESIMAGMYKLKKKSPYQVTKKGKYLFKDGKIVKKRAKAFKPRQFKAPDFLRVNKGQK